MGFGSSTEKLKGTGAGRPECLLVLAIFLLLFFAARLPLFSLGWDGQDANGHDADMFVHQPKKPDYMLLARVNGEDIYVPAYGHPAPMYEMFVLLGKAAQTVVDVQSLSDAQIIAILKMISSVFQLAIWLPLLWLVARHCSEQRTRIVGYICLTGLALSRLSIEGSNEFQLDSLFGFLMTGCYVLAVIAAGTGTAPGLVGAALVALAAAFVGLGKNEWTIVLALAGVGSIILVKMLDLAGYHLKEPRRLLLLSLATMVGLGLGNLANYLFEPSLYLSGWELVWRMVTSQSIVGVPGKTSLLAVTRERLPFIQAPLLLIAFIAWRIIASRRQLSPALVLASLFGFGLFAAFFISTWAAPISRYFAPAFAVLSILAAWQYVQQTAKAATLIAFTLVSSWFAVTGWSYAHSRNLAHMSIYGIRDLPPASGTNCARFLPVEDAYRKKIDFVHWGLGRPAAAQLAESHGGHLCPAN